MKKVSVVMPVHNALPYLDEALPSVLSQTFKDLVVIAVDDGSTDGSLEYLRKVTDPRLRVMALHTRGGAGPVERQVEYLDSNPDIGAVGTLVSSEDRAHSPALALSTE